MKRCVLALTAAALWGQGFSISGVVVDPSGAPVADTLVTLGRRGEVLKRETSTSFEGSFLFDRVSAGNVDLEVRREGFRTEILSVKAGPKTAPVRIALKIADLREELTVTDPARTVNANTSDNLDVVRFDAAALDNLPSLGLDPVATAARFLDNSSLGSNGADVVVDGMPTSERGVSSSAIVEVRINQNPYSAEFARPGRSRIEIITSPGATDFHGTANLQLRDSRLDARNPFALVRPDERRRVFEGTFTGPLGNGKKTSFLLSANYERADLAAVVLARTPAGERRENFPTPGRNTFLSARLNRQVSVNNQLSLRYEYFADDAKGQGAGGFVLPEASSDFHNREHHVYVQLRSVISPRLVNEVQTRNGRHHAPTVSRQPDVVKLIVLDAFTSGGAQADRLQTENHTQFHELLTWAAGKHLVKTGATSPDMSRRGQSDRTNFVGTYTFSSLEDFRLGRPFSFQRQQGEGYQVLWEKLLGFFVNDDFRVRQNLSLSMGARWDWQNYVGGIHNFTPRFAFAYSPGKGRKTVFRGGGGAFYDRSGWRPLADTVRYDGIRLRDVLIASPSYPIPASGGALPPNLVRFAAGARLPYTAQYSIGVERQLRNQASLAVTFIGSKGVSLFRSRDVNAPVIPFTARPNPAVGVLRQFETSANQRAEALEFTLRGKLTNWFTGTAQYVLGRTRNDTGGINAFPAYSYNVADEWGRADFDERHRFNMAGSFKCGKWVNFGLIVSASTGRPYNITTGSDGNRDGYANDRPPGLGRNTGQGPGAMTVDARWSHDFKLDRAVATLAFDSFNALNRTNYAGYVGTQTSPYFGLPVSARPPRRMQASVRVRF